MSETDAIDLLRDGIWTALLIAAPALAVAMIVGVGIALLQALTQVQEMTLTFVPKIVAILVVIAVSTPFMYQGLSNYALNLVDRIGAGF
ncbi:flagellar biosynthesis protein FliQ [Rhodospirillaceae bacterium SYSU D60014]|jgi:flagellar biosynthesis protein FliQ|uniref:flagellar biosynthesis protein FliQ n=1 Tax=Virgifigura deserti TaxID=2268457 RepID=UPI000E666DE9